MISLTNGKNILVTLWLKKWWQLGKKNGDVTNNCSSILDENSERLSWLSEKNAIISILDCLDLQCSRSSEQHKVIKCRAFVHPFIDLYTSSSQLEINLSVLIVNSYQKGLKWFVLNVVCTGTPHRCSWCRQAIPAVDGCKGSFWWKCWITLFCFIIFKYYWDTPLIPAVSLLCGKCNFFGMYSNWGREKEFNLWLKRQHNYMLSYDQLLHRNVGDYGPLLTCKQSHRSWGLTGFVKS